MKPFFDPSRRIKRVEKLTGGKQTGTAFEARGSADLNCLRGAGGPELILSVVEAPKPENGSMKSSIFYWFYKVLCFRENAF